MIRYYHIVFASLLLLPSLASAEFAWEDYYTFEDVELPKDLDPQIGGIDMDANGNLVACFHRGEVMTYDLKTKTWKVFATGLHEPLGIIAEKDGAILVVQRPEITRLRDTDNDGTADVYETVSDDWGMTGNYHEFNFGLVQDSKSNLYIALGTASNGSGVREEVRGEWSDAGGLTKEKFLFGGEYGEWKENKVSNEIPRMYARVPYRGCVLQIKPGSRKAVVYATGLRTPNGLYVDEEDQLWVSDNQGDWVGASKLHRIKEGGFHGHAASLLWDPKNPVTDAVPAKIPTEKLEARRTRAAGLFPQGDCGNSITQMIALDPRFSPTKTKDTIIIGEMNHARLIQFHKDVVNGVHQGAACHILNTTPMGSGNNRLLYSTDGKSLFLGKTHLSWPGREGMKKVTYNGKPYLAVEKVSLTKKGFKFEFNETIENVGEPSDYEVESFQIKYYASYGSPKNQLTKEPVAKASVKGNVLTIAMNEPLKADRVYDIRLPESISSKHGLISSPRFWYTAHVVH